MNMEKRKRPTKIVKLDIAKVEIREIDDNQPVDLNIIPQVIRIDRKFIHSITTIENNEEQIDIKYNTEETDFNEDKNCTDDSVESKIKIAPDYEIKLESVDNEEDMLQYDHVWNHPGENTPCLEGTSSDERGLSELKYEKPPVLEETCLDLNLSFHTNKLLRDHVPFYQQKKQFKCEKCKTFFSKTGLSLHKCYECYTCGKIIISKSHLRKHVNTHVKETIPTITLQGKIIKTKPKNILEERLIIHEKTCLDCNISFHTKVLLREHILLDHQKKEFKCEKCIQYFSSEKALLKHKCYECNICGWITNHKFRFQRHLTVHIPSDEKEKMLKNGDLQHVHIYRPRFQCNYCSQSYTVKQILKRHIENVHYGLKYACSQCGRQYSTQRTCSNCSSLKEKCPVCNKPFGTYARLCHHVKYVHQSKILGCRRNNAPCTSMNHADEFSILCLKCTERFTNMKNWIHHLKSVSHQQKQNKRYDLLSQKQHKRSDLPCQICNKLQSRSTHRTSHLMVVHGITILENKVFHCNFCDKNFSERNDAVEHVKSETHKRNKPTFECKICNKKLFYAKTLNSHKCNKRS